MRSETREGAVQTVKEFQELMTATRAFRAALTKDALAGRPPSAAALDALVSSLARLEAIPRREGKAVLALDGSELAVDLGYETGELKKDILYFTAGERAFLDYLATLHQDFKEHVDQGVKALSGLRFHCFITDRDGTTNNYCGRYDSSIQSAYNAIFLSRFAKARVENPMFITSAPLRAPGILDVSVNPEGTFIYGASKGREFLDLSGVRHEHPIPGEKRKILDALNARLRKLTASPEYEKFTLIGSGLQFKFGQSTLARQDIAGSIGAEESEALLARIRAIVAELDPEGRHLRIEDTGLDIEIILTVENAGETGNVKDFDKGDAVRLVTKALSIDLTRGPHLVCGDTASDLPMIEAVLAAAKDVRAVMVTRKEELARRARALVPDALILPEPDMLAAMLNALAS